MPVIECDADPIQLLQVNQALTDLQAENFIQKNLGDYLALVMEQAKPYPEQNSLTGYERTFNLLGSWNPAVEPLAAHVKNLAEYAGWVLEKNPRRKVRSAKKMTMTWKFNWKQTRKVMLDVMDEWIVKMEHKAFLLWERGPYGPGPKPGVR